MSVDSAERRGGEGTSPEEDWHSVYTEDRLVYAERKLHYKEGYKYLIFSCHLDNGYPLQSSSSLRT